MKKWTKKIWMSAAAVLIAIMSVSAIPASADVSRVVYFSIQSNIPCAANITELVYFNITNINTSSASISLHLFDDNGNEITTTGGSGNGTISNLTPGQSSAISGKQTLRWIGVYGGSSGATCTQRPAFGKITIDAESGLFIASGEVRSSQDGTANIFNDTTININGGQPF